MAKSKANGKADTFEAFASNPADAMTQAAQKAMAFSGQFGELGQNNLEAVGQSVKAAAAGMEAINTRAFAFMKSSMERNLEAMGALTSVKSVEDFTSQQSDFASQTMKSMMTEFQELSSLFSNTVRDAAAPLNAQAGTIAEKIQSAG